jgi:hypothetical protein
MSDFVWGDTAEEISANPHPDALTKHGIEIITAIKECNYMNFTRRIVVLVVGDNVAQGHFKPSKEWFHYESRESGTNFYENVYFVSCSSLFPHQANISESNTQNQEQLYNTMMDNEVAFVRGGTISSFLYATVFCVFGRISESDKQLFSAAVRDPNTRQLTCRQLPIEYHDTILEEEKAELEQNNKYHSSYDRRQNEHALSKNVLVSGTEDHIVHDLGDHLEKTLTEACEHVLVSGTQDHFVHELGDHLANTLTEACEHVLVSGTQDHFVHELGDHLANTLTEACEHVLVSGTEDHFDRSVQTGAHV